MSLLKLSIIIPSYNESAQIKLQAISKIADYTKKLNLPYEVIIVDDQSTNGTLEIVRQAVKNKKNFRLIENPHGGKAITVMTGLLSSKGDFALFTDMDQATPIEEFNKFLPLLENGVDIIIGSRHGRKGAPVMRKLAGWGFSVLRNIILGLPYKDTQVGFKSFNRKSIDIIFPRLLKKWQRLNVRGAAVNAGFDVEVLYLAKKHGLDVKEVEVTWRHVENLKQVQLIQDSLEAIRDMLRIRWEDLLGKY